MKNNMMFSSHHDAPVALPDTLRVLSATVNRTSRSNQVIGPQHRVEPITGLKAMTLWAAYQHFEEKSKGSIEVGKLADFVILSDNPLTIDRTKIADIKVLETIKKGKSVYKLDENKVAVESTSCLDSPRCSQALVAYWPDSPLTFSFGLPHRHAPE
jgi:predicted amidohydrolase YtcJ